MVDKMLRVAGRSEDGTAKAIKTDLEGNLGVQQVATKILKSLSNYSNVVGTFETIGETQSTSASNLSPILTPFPEKIIWLENNTDADLEIDYLYLHGGSGNGTVFSSVAVEAIIPAGESREFTKKDIAKLGEPSVGVSFRLLATDATSGSVNIKVIGSQSFPSRNYQTGAEMLKEYTEETEVLGQKLIYGKNVASTSSSAKPILTPFPEKIIWIENNTDADITMENLYIHPSEGEGNYYEYYQVDQTVKAGESKEITKEQVKRLGVASIGISFSLEALNATEGNVSIKVFGGVSSARNVISGIDSNSEEEIEVSLLKDNEGKGVVRTVDAAPFAYDEVTESKRVTLLGRNRKIVAFADGELPADDGVRYYPGGDSNYYTTTQQELTDVRDMKNFTISIFNDLDVDIEVAVGVSSRQGDSATTTKHVFLPSTPVTIAAGERDRLTGDEYAFLNQTFGYMVLRVNPAAAPTTGGLYVDVEGDIR